MAHLHGTSLLGPGLASLALSMLGKPKILLLYIQCGMEQSVSHFRCPVVAIKQNHLYWVLGLGQCTIYNTPPASIVVGMLHTFVVVRVTTYSIQSSSPSCGVRIFPKTFQVVASRRGVTSLTRKKLLELIEQEDPLPISSSLSDSFLLLERSGKHTTGQTYSFKADGRTCCVV
jgi:hypothetical protein